MNRNVAFLAVGFALVALGIASLAGCSSGCSVTIAPWELFSRAPNVDGVELPHENRLTMQSDACPDVLDLGFSSARVEVRGDAQVKGIDAVYEVNEAEPGDATIRPGPDGPVVESASGRPVLVRTALVRVPPKTLVRVKASFGSVTVSGIEGADEVLAESDSGTVTIERLRDVARVRGRTSFGSVALVEGAGVGPVELRSDAGSVSASDVESRSGVTMRSGFGSVDARNVSAAESLDCRTDSGSITAIDVRTEKGEFRSSFGEVRIERSAFGHVSAKTDMGGVRLEGCTYRTKDVGTEFGRVVETK